MGMVMKSALDGSAVLCSFLSFNPSGMSGGRCIPFICQTLKSKEVLGNSFKGTRSFSLFDKWTRNKHRGEDKKPVRL